MMNKLPKMITDPLVDGENNVVLCDTGYAINGGCLTPTLQAIQSHYKSRLHLLPISGASGGGGIFQRPSCSEEPVVSIQLIPSNAPKIKLESAPLLASIELHQIVIDQETSTVSAGAAITLDQLNQALANTLGPQYKVMGADLTSYSYAQVGATFMTGGMGPQRQYFSDSVLEALLYDGTAIKSISGNELKRYAGTYGWTGMTVAVRCAFHQLPQNEVAFALPVHNTPEGLGRLLDHLAVYCHLDSSTSPITNAEGQANIILGIEHVTKRAMDPMFALNQDTQAVDRARGLAAKCDAAEADGLVFINGFSDLHSDDLLMSLLDEVHSDQPTIAGIALEHTEVFNDPEIMRGVREAIPYAARTQAPNGKYIYKGHTDATIRLDLKHTADAMAALWRINQTYVQAVSNYFDQHTSVWGQILVYGHLNPYGVDPHNRVTLASDDHESYQAAVKFVHQKRDEFYRALSHLCDSGIAAFIGGEKGAGSEYEMFEAFGGPQHAPERLREKFVLQQQAIVNASPLFNWRALPPYF